MNYGKLIKKTEVKGVGIEKTTVFHDKQAITERWRFEERFRVRSIKEARDKLIEIDDLITSNPTTYIDPEIRYVGRALLKTRGKFDIIFCYTKIVFDKE